MKDTIGSILRARQTRPQQVGEPGAWWRRSTSHWLGGAVGLILLLVVAAAPATEPASDDDQPSELIAGLNSAEALALGERMYRQGILPSGEALRARVQEDVEIDGTWFSCQNCHLRSGMGSIEGTVITQPTTGPWLYKPLVGAEMSAESQARVPARLDPPPFRPAYTDRSLARAIWAGKDAGGRDLHWAMPRYRMSHDDMKILVHYLKNLSAEFSPGVDDTTISFATVVSHDISDSDRQAMVGTLQAHIVDHNIQSRHQERRARHGPFYKEEKNVPYRRYSLAVWELHGDPESWPGQLEAYYRKAPVFALLGGLVSGDWAPVHEFCERRQVPCLFPVTDFPVVSDSDWYTVYFSKGLYQEGETAARFLRRSDSVPADHAAVQVFRDTPAGRALASGFAAGRASAGLSPAVDFALDPVKAIDPELLPRLAEEHPDAAFVLWLEPRDMEMLESLATLDQKPPVIILSTNLLGESALLLPEPLRSVITLTHPYAFAADEERSRMSVERWLQAKKLPITNFEIQAKMYFVGWTLSGLVKKMRDDFYRDYLLDILGMNRDQYYSIAVYPRLSFGPGQRYAAKGCYMVQLTPGPDPQFARVSDWVIH